MMPFTVLKTRFESTSFKYTSITRALVDIYRREGIRGYFKGFGVTVIRDAPFAGIYVFFYERIRNLSCQSGISAGVGVNLSSGLISGFMATLCTHPFDIVKTRIQVDTVKVSAMDAARNIIEMKGIRGMFAGMLPRMLRKSCSSAISWAVYEEFVRR
jgi:solute carrier family 25, member 38